jgi:hypothetical protein
MIDVILKDRKGHTFIGKKSTERWKQSLELCYQPSYIRSHQWLEEARKNPPLESSEGA